jgi:hypothetical protein
MAIDVVAQREIGAEPRHVAAYAMDPANDAVWIGGIETARWVTDPPLRAGSRVERVARFLGRRIEYVLEVSDLEPEARLRMVSVKSPFPMTVTYEFEPCGSATTARIRIGGGPGGVVGLFSPPLAIAVRRSISGDLKRLDAATTLS